MTVSSCSSANSTICLDPPRGDVIIFRYPLNPKKNFIKRVIGLPGEKVQIRSGKIYVNGEKVPEPYPFNHADYDWGPVHHRIRRVFCPRRQSSRVVRLAFLGHVAVPRKTSSAKPGSVTQNWGIVQHYSLAAGQ